MKHILKLTIILLLCVNTSPLIAQMAIEHDIDVLYENADMFQLDNEQRAAVKQARQKKHHTNPDDAAYDYFNDASDSDVYDSQRNSQFSDSEVSNTSNDTNNRLDQSAFDYFTESESQTDQRSPRATQHSDSGDAAYDFFTEGRQETSSGDDIDSGTYDFYTESDTDSQRSRSQASQRRSFSDTVHDQSGEADTYDFYSQ